jgi:Tol biopolymer transport system component
MPIPSNRARRIGRAALVLTAGAATALAATGLMAKTFGEWSTPVSAEQGSDPSLNTAFNDGCPILSPDGLSLYMATNRPGGKGGQDIWVAHRDSVTSGWGAPENLGAPVNTADNEFCPDPTRGKRLFFVRAPAPTLVGDIYQTRLDHDGWREPERLPDTVNSPAEEWSPSYFEDDAGNSVLYFSSTRAGTQDIYQSVNFGPATPVAELNTAFDDARPNVRHDGREIVFDSTRPGTLGGPDIWSAERDSNTGAWGAPEHRTELSSAAGDTRASLSWDGTFILVGSARTGGEGASDIYLATRPRVTGQ